MLEPYIESALSCKLVIDAGCHIGPFAFALMDCLISDCQLEICSWETLVPLINRWMTLLECSFVGTLCLYDSDKDSGEVALVDD